MKKSAKKLKLHRETLHNMAQVKGGYFTNYTYCVTQFSGCQGAYCETGTNGQISFCICD